MNLKELKIGESATIDAIGGTKELRQHFLDMGLVPGTNIKLVKYAPMGDPAEYLIHGYELTLRLSDAEKINVSKITGTIENDFGDTIDPTINAPHPGLGEGGKYHVKAAENPLSDNTILTFALAGNQNCGKTTLFNQLTGSNQHVGNFPGVPVDKKSGPIRGFNNTDVTDLPGIYSMSPYTPEEIVSREFILNEKPNGIINIVDASNIERNLFLTMQLMELDVPMIHGAIGGWFGQITTIMPGNNTLDMIYPHREEPDDSDGNPSFTPAIVAGIQVSEAVKVLLGYEDTLQRKLLVIDTFANDYQVVEL